jgi:hypothetical protein
MKTHRTILTGIASAIFVSLWISSCREKGEVTHLKVQKTTPSRPMVSLKGTQPPSSNQEQTKKQPYTWTLPKGWSDKPASGMRLATIIIPSETNGVSLEASITELGGDLLGNINRWRGQIGLPALTQEALPATLQEFDTPLGKNGKGFSAFLTNSASSQNAMLTAIIPRPSGTSVFIKIKGSQKSLQAIETAFSQFIQSIR